MAVAALTGYPKNPKKIVLVEALKVASGIAQSVSLNISIAYSNALSSPPGITIE